MGMTGIEAAMQAVEDTLSANMEAKITALNAAYDDGIECSTSLTYEWYKKNFAAQDYPICVLDAATSTPEERYVGAMTEQHKILVFVADTDPDAKQLVKKIFRYARAVREILSVNYDLGGVSHSISIISTEYSPTFTDKERKHLKAAAVEVDVFKEERT